MFRRFDWRQESWNERTLPIDVFQKGFDLSVVWLKSFVELFLPSSTQFQEWTFLLTLVEFTVVFQRNIDEWI